MYATEFKVNDDYKLAIFNLINLKPHILFHSNGVAIWHGLPDITYINANSCCQTENFKFDEVEFFRAYPSLKPL